MFIGAVLIVRTKEFKTYLTDRVGNFEELEPYFPFWKIQAENPNLVNGYLEIIGICYDQLRRNNTIFPKRTRRKCREVRDSTQKSE